MAEPIVVTLSHSLGRAEARRRIDGGIGRLFAHLPGAAEVKHSWQDDRLNLQINAMGQAMSGIIDVEDNAVRIEMMLPPMLALFGKRIREALQSKGGALLEDKRR
jgi:hypothetical protein